MPWSSDFGICEHISLSSPNGKAHSPLLRPSRLLYPRQHPLPPFRIFFRIFKKTSPQGFISLSPTRKNFSVAKDKAVDWRWHGRGGKHEIDISIPPGGRRSVDQAISSRKRHHAAKSGTDSRSDTESPSRYDSIFSESDSNSSATQPLAH